MTLAVSETPAPKPHSGPGSSLTGKERLIVVTADGKVGDLVEQVWGERCLVLPPEGDWSTRLGRSSTDVVLLDPRVSMNRLRFKDLSGASRVAVLRSRTRPGGIARIHRDVLGGRLRSGGQLELPAAASSLRADTYAVVRPRVPTARRWYSATDGPGGFIDRLRDAGAHFVVLRWYDELPALPPGEDLDLLVLDKDVHVVEEVLAERPGTEPCDLYSVSGLPGTDFHSMAYLPPLLAQRTVVRSQLLRGRFPVPHPHDAFLGLAYHVAYHKGPASGLPVERNEATQTGVDHDYLSVLGAMAEAAGFEAPHTLAEIDHLLTEQGVRPSRDTLHRLAVVNPWAGELAARSTGESAPGLCVFFIRQAAVDAGATDAIVDRIKSEGFTILRCAMLNAEARERVTHAVRGGNWERGPYALSGGPPVIAVVTMDVLPAPVDARTRAEWPSLDNARVLVKHQIRDLFNADRVVSERCNILHSSDNAVEAVDYLTCALPADAAQLLTEARDLGARFASSPDRIRDLTRHGRRARLELVAERGDLLVRKQFRPGCERFAARERLVAEHLAAHCEHLLPLVSAGPDTVVVPYRENTLQFDRRRRQLLPLRVVHAAMATAKYVYTQGFALIDFTPANLIVTPGGRVYVVDFEFLQRYDELPRTFARSYDIAGPPLDFEGDLPVDAYGLGYVAGWQPYVGLTFDQLARLPLWAQHLLRLRYRLLVSWPQSIRDQIGVNRRRSVRIAGRFGVRMRSVPALFKRHL
jgi:hypothetical protein